MTYFPATLCALPCISQFFGYKRPVNEADRLSTDRGHAGLRFWRRLMLAVLLFWVVTPCRLVGRRQRVFRRYPRKGPRGVTSYNDVTAVRASLIPGTRVPASDVGWRLVCVQLVARFQSSESGRMACGEGDTATAIARQDRVASGSSAIYIPAGRTLRGYRPACFLETNCYVLKCIPAEFLSFLTVILEPPRVRRTYQRIRPRKCSYFLFERSCEGDVFLTSDLNNLQHLCEVLIKAAALLRHFRRRETTLKA
jgi:hypothetical protein